MASFKLNRKVCHSLLVMALCFLTVVRSQTTPPSGTTAAPMTTAQVGNMLTNGQTTEILMTEVMTEAQTQVVTEGMTEGGRTIPDATPPILDTTFGQVSGKALTVVDNKIIFAYLGVPYAAPPVGDLRFAKPQPPETWNDIVEALDYSSPCPQGPNTFVGPSFDEDCLSLNIFVPQGGGSDPLPIMVYIHGGGFAYTGSEKDSVENLAAAGGLIVVSFNYRLGVFGFLSTNDDCARGNWGLWDQRLAIQWVKDNADRFGGDPDKITIFGKSAGATSVLYQALSPLNSPDLFQRIISQSPVRFNYISSDPYANAQLTKMLAQSLGYDDTKDSRELVRLLRNQSVEDILDAYEILQATVPIRFYPVIDGEFLRGADLFDTSQYDLLIGFNTGDTSLSSGDNDGLTKDEFLNNVDMNLAALCRDYDECKNRDLAVQATVFAYNNVEDLNNNETENFARLLQVAQDTHFDSFVSSIARLHQENGGNTYAYKFTYEDTEFGAIPAPPEVQPRPGHLEDLYYLFGNEPLFTSGNEDQQALARAFMQYWTNFAKNGDPNVGNTDYIDSYPAWPKFDTDTQSYMILEPNATIGQNYASEAHQFWNEYIADLLEEGETPDADSELCVHDAEVPVWEDLPPQETITHEITSLGQITGIALYVGTSNEDGSPSKVNVVRGIPYAEPPVGELRFAPPKEVKGWDGILNGTKPAPQCPDSTDSTDWDEDCLTLDVTFPHGNGSFPVVVFIGGNKFQSSRSPPHAEGLAAGANAVVVTFRYRVGPLGFLSTGDTSTSGNYGLQDVIAVLHFVQNHIGDFNGDPAKVTVMGYGTGGAIVNLLLHIKQAEGLFHRAISLGETAGARFLANVEEQDPLSFGEHLGCKGESSELIDCLKSENLTVHDILNATESMDAHFFPTVDNDLLPDVIPNLIKTSPHTKVDYLIGVTQNQAATMLMMMMEDMGDCPTEEAFREHIGSVIDMHMKDPGPVSQVIASEYLANLDDDDYDDDSEDNPCPLMKRFMEFLQDFMVVLPIIHTAESHVEAGGRVFLLSFQQHPRYRSEHTSDMMPSMGPSRGDDIQYLLGMPYSPNSPGCYGPEDRETTLALMRILEHFFDSGDPNPLEDLAMQDDSEWPEFEPESRRYLEVDACPSVSETGFGGSRLRFWRETIFVLIAPPPVEKCVVGGRLGLSLTPAQAETIIELFIGITIALLVVIVLVCGACCGATKQIKENKVSAYELGHEIPTWTPNGEEESDML